MENQRKFMKWAAKASQLGIKEPSDWYKVNKKVRTSQKSKTNS
jgi:hypothetical protein